MIRQMETLGFLLPFREDGVLDFFLAVSSAKKIGEGQNAGVDVHLFPLSKPRVSVCRILTHC